MVVIKLQYKDDIRRVTADHWLNFAELKGLAQSLYETLPSSYVFKYKDDEGDLITVASDRELLEAFRLAKDQEIVRISIVPQQESKPNVNANQRTDGKQTSFVDMLSELVEGNPFIRDLLNNLEIEVKSIPESLKKEFCPAQNQSSQSEVVHPAMCDGCNSQIRGIRYKCKSCPDYDLCEKCYDIGGVHVPAEHQFEKILRPARPTGWCPYYQRRNCHFRQEDVPQSEVVHPATCDGCGCRIKGLRFKCNNCLDYDLCQACKEKNIHNDHTFTTILRPAMPCRRPDSPSCMRKPETTSPKAEEPKAEEPAPKPQVQIPTPSAPVQIIPIKVEQPKPVEIKVETPVPSVPKVEPSAPKVEQPAPVTVPVVSQPQVQAPKVPETILQAQPPKEDRPLSPFEQKLKQLEEMGFLNRAKNVELMVKHSGDMVRIVRDLLDA